MPKWHTLSLLLLAQRSFLLYLFNENKYLCIYFDIETIGTGLVTF